MLWSSSKLRYLLLSAILLAQLLLSSSSSRHVLKPSVLQGAPFTQCSHMQSVLQLLPGQTQHLHWAATRVRSALHDGSPGTERRPVQESLAPGLLLKKCFSWMGLRRISNSERQQRASLCVSLQLQFPRESPLLCCYSSSEAGSCWEPVYQMPLISSISYCPDTKPVKACTLVRALVAQYSRISWAHLHLHRN